MVKGGDDFVWGSYTDLFYRNELLGGVHENRPIIEDFAEKDGELIFLDQHPGIHENHREIYHQVHRLKPMSAFECGCGAAQHLINIKKTSPDVVLGGCDYSQSQIDLGFEHFDLDNYEFSKNLLVRDLTNNQGIEELGKYEFVYTQAVTMHLSYERAKKFLLNMKKISTKYIFLIENFTMHDYDSLINECLPEYERVVGKNKYISAILLVRK